MCGCDRGTIKKEDLENLSMKFREDQIEYLSNVFPLMITLQKMVSKGEIL